MKKALYFSLARDFMGGSYKVVAITSERGGRWYGRDCRYDLPTNGVNIDIKGRFDTKDAACEAVEHVNKIKRAHADHIRETLDAYNLAQAAERREISEYLQALETVPGV